MKKLSNNELELVNSGVFYVCNEVWNDPLNSNSFPGTVDNPFFIIYAQFAKKKRILLTTKKLLSGKKSIGREEAFQGKHCNKCDETIFKLTFSDVVFEFYRLDEETHSVDINL